MTKQNEKIVTTIDLLRHGECEGGAIYRGSTDVALSSVGKQQMLATTQQWTGWQRVISSPLQRCRLFAESQAASHNLPITVDERWREIHFGVWEGKLRQEVWDTDRDLVQRYFSDPGSVTPEGGEPLTEVLARVKDAWSDLLKMHRGEHVLVVQHAGTIRLLLTHILNMPLSGSTRFDVSFAALSRIRIYHDGDDHYPVLAAHYPGTTE